MLILKLTQKTELLNLKVHHICCISNILYREIPASEMYNQELDYRKYQFTIRDIQSFAEPFRPIVDGTLLKDQALTLFRFFF